MTPDSRPTVRIGMIQSTDHIKFKCGGNFRAVDLSGRTVFFGLKDEQYHARLLSSTPARVEYAVRLAISTTKNEAEKLQTDFKRRGIETVLWHQGLVLSLESRQIDNREYWIVTEHFKDRVDAETFAKNYRPVGEAVVVRNVLDASKGVFDLGGHKIEGGVQIIPDESAPIYLADVVVGIEFHWQHKRTEQLEGLLEISLNSRGHLVAINELDMERYLISVNSSEMTAENPIELLKAQTVVARSTVLATMGKHHYDENFHLCSDDHCQCYHGMGNISEASILAAEQTTGEVLTYDGQVCDARYAKICGGVMEDYAHVWDNRSVPYLVAGVDGPANIDYPLDTEKKARDYIDSKPNVFCNTEKYKITTPLPYNSTELFRWTVSYSKKELEEIIQQKTGEDLGELIDILPGERGPSGRLVTIDIVGSKKTLRVGKELQIRRVLSEKHLYSSCFYINRDLDDAGNVIRFHLIGAGWGHGVGLCQVGATVMAQLDYDYREILSHYYKNTQLQKVYN